jgi:tetratricopeptide (TPR) repeat protein
VVPRDSATRQWLVGPAADLLLGCGLLYALLFLALSAVGDGMRLLPVWLLPALLLLVSLPHYGATLVRVYEHRSDRRRYALFTVWATLAVAAVFVVSLYDAVVGSIFLTVYLTWSPWHYAGQNYGLASMFLGRRGIALTPAHKRWLQACFTLSYALVFVSFHRASGPGVPQFSAALGGGTAVAFRPIGIPDEVAVPASLLLLAAYLIALGICARALLRVARPAALLPTAALIFTQALWFSLPTLFRSAGIRTGLAHVDLYAGVPDWMALAHAAQYLWVTSYYARATEAWKSQLVYYAKVLVAGVGIWSFPLLLFSPDLFGPRASGPALVMLIATAVNIHHFILDGAIWKLRDGRIASVLLRAVPAADDVRPLRPWIRRAVWAAAGSWVLLHTAASWELDRLRERVASDAAGVRAAVSRLRWVGLDDADLHFRLGVDAGARGDLATARREFERSLLLEDSARAWVGLAHTEFHEGQPDRARAALARAVRAEPEDVETWLQSSEVWAALGDAERAQGALARAASLAPDRLDLQQRAAAGAPAPGP